MSDFLEKIEAAIAGVHAQDNSGLDVAAVTAKVMEQIEPHVTALQNQVETLTAAQGTDEGGAAVLASRVGDLETGLGDLIAKLKGGETEAALAAATALVSPPNDAPELPPAA